MSFFLLQLISLHFLLDRGKKKLAQVIKETKDQLTSLQSKLEMANNGKMKNEDFLDGIFSHI